VRKRIVPLVRQNPASQAQRFSPDMFYVNEFADRLKQHDGKVFELLFR